ncbi:hypothetical protein Hanom_Chr04g00383741 [Helianthus anomalus]
MQSQIVDKVEVFLKIINEAPKALVLKAVLIPTTIKHMLLLCVDHFFLFLSFFIVFMALAVCKIFPACE